ncbi:hypothetical protein GMOD_00009115 [Pyrenophora seminiperda CCB06]|uniref:Uncharacterized protein n=1 Tax=Pyrenophora seminiperda CCB06 TaxID=1302712 RepID=A0A3M7MFQ4_9PLEO|nr:hypothetical protein GMOD_00009115 [Pyrenophora seminiperda CCB06]
MTHTASQPVLALQFPDPRFSIDFNTYSLDTSAYAMSRNYMQELFPGQNKPLPPPKAGTLLNGTLRAKPRHSPLAACTTQSVAGNYDPKSPERPVMLEGLPSDRSNRSPPSFNSTVSSSMASGTLGHPAKKGKDIKKPQISLLHLPQTTVEHILEYVLIRKRAITITPHRSQDSTQHLRRQPYDCDAVEIRSMLVHPALLLSRQMRALGLSILYRKGLFLIDLCDMKTGIASTESGTEKEWDCWAESKTPRVVQEALKRALNVRLQLPVPSAEAPFGRGAKKNKTDHHDDQPTVYESLQVITFMINGVSKNTPKEQPRSASPAGPQILRRKLSFRSAKRPDSLEFACRGDSPVPQPREPLRKLEIVLVKSRTDAEVHSQILDMITTCSSIPVSKSLEYYIQLGKDRRLWAKRDKGTWQKCEPDGAELLHDLRYLGRIMLKSQSAQKPESDKIVAVRPMKRAKSTSKEKVWYRHHLTGEKLHKDPPQRSAQKVQLFKEGMTAKKDQRGGEPVETGNITWH